MLAFLYPEQSVTQAGPVDREARDGPCEAAHHGPGALVERPQPVDDAPVVADVGVIVRDVPGADLPVRAEADQLGVEGEEGLIRAPRRVVLGCVIGEAGPRCVPLASRWSNSEEAPLAHDVAHLDEQIGVLVLGHLDHAAQPHLVQKLPGVVILRDVRGAVGSRHGHGWYGAGQDGGMPGLRTSDGVRLHYRVDGPDGAPPVVLLHGLGSDGEADEPLVGAIGDRLRVARLDLRGHGHSEPLTDPSRYGWFGRAALDVVELMDALGWDAPGLAGGSLGAATATAVALSHPRRVGRLALIGPAIGAGPGLANPVVTGFLEGLRDQGLLGLFEAVISAVPDLIAPGVVEQVRANYGRQDDAAMRACVVALTESVLMDDMSELGRIAAPTLVIGQRSDPLHPWDLAEEHAGRIPGATLVGGSDGEQGLTMDPDRFADVLVEFFAG